MIAHTTGEYLVCIAHFRGLSNWAPASCNAGNWQSALPLWAILLSIAGPSRVIVSLTKVYSKIWNPLFVGYTTVFADNWLQSVHPSPSCLRRLRHRFAVMHRRECARFAG